MNANTAVIPGKLVLPQGKIKSKTKQKTSSKTNKKKSLFVPRQTLIKFGVGVLVLIIFLGSGFGYVKAYSEKIYPKLTVAGVKVGGMTIDEAKKKIEEKANELNEQGPEITYNDQTLNPKLDEMGVTFNVDEAVQSAYNFSRSGNLFAKLKENWQVLIHNHQIEIIPQIDEQKFDEYLSQIAKQVEIPAFDKQVQDGTGQVLDEGQDGLVVDKDALANQIQETLASGTPNASIQLPTKVVERNVITIYPHAQPGRYPGRYIDINLSEQTLYAFEGSTLVNQFLISSGKRGYATPTGEFNVYSMSRANLMSGPDYYLPNVPWISRFAPGPISVHGTYWHNNFGTPMSHGCINASIPDAEWVYNFVDIGTPVYVHY